MCATAICASARAHIVSKLSGVCARFYGLAGDENFLTANGEHPNYAINRSCYVHFYSLALAAGAVS
jgi:hypothetical protein